jgi:hypothetical protein
MAYHSTCTSLQKCLCTESRVRFGVQNDSDSECAARYQSLKRYRQRADESNLVTAQPTVNHMMCQKKPRALLVASRSLLAPTATDIAIDQLHVGSKLYSISEEAQRRFTMNERTQCQKAQTLQVAVFHVILVVIECYVCAHG